ncbi:hypothetical protein C5167_046658 [Papaver somniferum]|uniref:Zinc/iron-chelating domain-containing protein n=1 Tax=Papaver somniferum TaxID=3469 RepID=A0A4Y7LGN7_PAPSO|nr:uncharacterized protein LOC113321321 [Papaver somniferum]RZC83872.1 hypothetical protein C5167_046658 [Papaver somniferum]
MFLMFSTSSGSTSFQSVICRLQHQRKVKMRQKEEITMVKPRKINKTGTTFSGFGGGRKEQTWGCVKGCGACCKLDKGPSFATPEEIFENPDDIQLYKNMIGPDGWCIHYEQTTRTCSIYSDRPYFCRVEPGVFEELYGIDGKRFNKEACGSCRDTIKAIYGASSKELENFNRSVRNSNCKS